MENLSGRRRFPVTVNDREVLVYEGLTILQALLQEDIPIPHLCHDIRLDRSYGNCGLCVVTLCGEGLAERDVKSCQTPVREGMVIHTATPRLEHYRKIRLEQLLSDHNADCVAPCVTTCPANIDIQGFLRQVGNGNHEAAVRVIKEHNPFPSVCGRVCPHPCEAACRRNLVDEPVAINAVKRFAADWDLARETPWIPRCAPSTGRRIAVVGAGPSGLTAAYYSAILGHEVTVFDRQPEPGGMMRYGIPAYRLPKEALDREIRSIRETGVRIVTGKALGTHLRLEDLRHDFDVVYLAIGSWQPTPLQIEGENLDGVWQGIRYLEQEAKGMDTCTGCDVVVVGGGNTAVDCARTALRKGARTVQLVYRRTRDEMPAEPQEIEEAEREGVQLQFLMAPSRIVTENGRKVLHCMRMTLGPEDRSGRRRPVPVEGSDVPLAADTIIGAIGQSTNTQFLYHDLPVRLNKWGDIEIDGRTAQTSESNVFAGGDCVTGPSTVIQAVAAGRHAAEAMDCYLRLGYVRTGHEDYSCSRGSLEDLPRWAFEEMPRLARARQPQLSPDRRVSGFDEVERALPEDEARREARRCLRCGCTERYDCALRKEATAHGIEFVKPVHERPYFPVIDDHPYIMRDPNKCISCGRCIAACAEIEGPDVLAFYMKDGRQLVGTRDGRQLQETDCVSCGQCVNACPCGALDYRRERGKVFRAIHDPAKTVVAFVAPAVRSVVSSHFGIPFDQASGFMAGLLKRLGFDRVFDFAFAADLTVVEETTEFLTRIAAAKEQEADSGNRVKSLEIGSQGKASEIIEGETLRGNAHEISSGGVSPEGETPRGKALGSALPQFTSCCPGWVNFVERRYPALIPHLSSCKSPQMMMGSVVKNHFGRMAGISREDLYVVSIVPCMAKKSEAARPEFAPEGVRDVDAVLTSSEMLEMVRLAMIDTDTVEPALFDEPYRHVSGAGILFGASGGVAEAALRMAVERLTGEVRGDGLEFAEIRGFEGVKEAAVEAGGSLIRVAVISGLRNAEPIVRRILDGEDVGYDLIEVMACPGGCICGAGHPVPEKAGDMDRRQRVLVDIDRTSTLRRSQENPDILRLYREFIGEPNSPIAHRLLHTAYKPARAGNAAVPVRRSDSAFLSSELTICVCDSCSRHGADELFHSLTRLVASLKMDSYMRIRTIRLREDHPEGIHITLDGRRIPESLIGDVFRSLAGDAGQALHRYEDDDPS